METATLLALLDREATKIAETNVGMSALLCSAAAKIRSLEGQAASTTEATKGYTLEDVARLKRDMDAGRRPNINATGVNIPVLRL